MSAVRGYRDLRATPSPMGMSVLHTVRVTAPNGSSCTTGVSIHARLYSHKHRGMSSSASTVDEMVIITLSTHTHVMSPGLHTMT